MPHKKTKIVCTIGPSTWEADMLRKLAVAGMNVARLNFSHGNQQEKLRQIKEIRKISQDLNKPIAILADLSGPKLRLGDIEGTQQIKTGEILTFSFDPKDGELPIQFDLSPFIKPSHRLFLNDGLVELTVSAVDGQTITAKADNAGWISSKKGVNVPDTTLSTAAFTDKDRSDAAFAIEAGVEYLALSFVQTVEHITQARDMITKAHSSAKIIVKVEKPGAIDIIEDIIQETDAVMVARGDLGIEIPASQVPLIQQRLINLCRQHQKPVIVATQMLESMIENPRPTRAETSDVAYAVMDQVDAVMLSGESASGKYPIEAVAIMKEIILTVESNIEYADSHHIDWDAVADENRGFSAIASSAALLAKTIEAKAIVVATTTGRTARLLSSFRPTAAIVAVTHDEDTLNRLALVWGVRSVLTKPYADYDKFLEKSIEAVLDRGFAKKGDKIVVISGTNIGISGNTDTIKTLIL